MGAFSGDYSRAYPGMYDEEKRYVGVLPQQSSGAIKRPVVDADLMDHLLCQTHMLRAFVEEVLGSGAPADGFLIAEASSPSNNFKVTAGVYYNNGLRARITANTDYVSTGAHPNDIHARSTTMAETILTDSAANWNVNELAGRYLVPDATVPANRYLIASNTATQITVQPGDTMVSDGAVAGVDYYVELSTPGGARTDVVYLDCYLDEWDKNEDSNLLHTIGGSPYETCNRLKIIQVVKVRENSTTIPTDGADSDGNYHWYIKLAELARTATANVTTAMITDYRVDIKRALWQVPDLDVGGGYGDVVDGGLSIDAQGNLESDGYGVFDEGLKVNKDSASPSSDMLELDYDQDYSTAKAGYITWGSNAGHPRFGAEASGVDEQFFMNKNLIIQGEDISGNPETTYIEVDTTDAANNPAFFRAKAKDATRTGTVQLGLTPAVDEPNIAEFQIVESAGVFSEDPYYRFTSDQTDTHVYVDGDFRAKADLRLQYDQGSLPGSDTEISFVGNGAVANYPYLKWVVGDYQFEMNYGLKIYASLGTGNIPEVDVFSADSANKRACRLKMTSYDTSSNDFEHRICTGIDADATIITDGKCNIGNYLIIEGADGAAVPAFRFMSKRASATYNVDDFELICFGDIIAHGDHLMVGQQWSTKASATSYVKFYADAGADNGRITFVGASDLFKMNEDLELYKNRSGESTYFQITSMNDETAYIQLSATSGAAGSPANYFRLYSNEEVVIGGTSNPNYITFASRWADAAYGGAGATTYANFRFQNRDTAENVRDGMVRVDINGDLILRGSTWPTITMGDGVASPQCFIAMGDWDMVSGYPYDANVYLHSNPVDWSDWLKVGLNGTTLNRGLYVEGHITMAELSGQPTGLSLSKDGTFWIQTDGKFYYIANGGTVYSLTGTPVP